MTMQAAFEKAKQKTAPALNVELCLYKIADAMQLPLTYANGSVIGDGKFLINTGAGFSVPLTVRAVKTFMEEHFNVLFHIRGNLYFLISYYPKTQVVSAFMIDRSKLVVDGKIIAPETVITKDMPLQNAVATLGTAVVQSFYYKGEWKELKLPK